MARCRKLFATGRRRLAVQPLASPVIHWNEALERSEHVEWRFRLAEGDSVEDPLHLTSGTRIAKVDTMARQTHRRAVR